MKLYAIFPAVLAVLFAACAPVAKRPNLPFAAYSKEYASKPDLAKVEHDYPLTPAQRADLTPASLATLTQEELDQIYARLTAGPIPDGPYQGTVIFADGGGLRRLKEILGGIKGFAADLGVDKLERFAETLWKGKVFYRDPMELRNQITHRRALSRLFKADLSQMRTATINGRKVGLLFPAKLYCGQSLLDSRKESVIIDYFFGDEIDGYLPAFDYIAGRDGLQIRDEIRMVRPGFYLGRAYLGKVFLLDFTLYKKDVAEAGKAEFATTGKTREDCRPGAQQVARTAGF
ncbi:MAG TPA: hypothetical protein VGX68_08135 [Thermoanaerobaculia bacterium]|nr:hypothetical protein [Thermoanaerobaculia bacterium]